MPNDAEAYPQDGPEAVARAYDAVCTPAFFGYDADLRLRYRGRIDRATPGRSGRAALDRGNGPGTSGAAPLDGLLDQVARVAPRP